MTISCVAEAVATNSAPSATSHGDVAGLQKRQEHDRGDQQELREYQPPAPPAEQGESTGASSASTIGAHRNLMV